MLQPVRVGQQHQHRIGEVAVVSCAGRSARIPRSHGEGRRVHHALLRTGPATARLCDVSRAVELESVTYPRRDGLWAPLHRTACAIKPVICF